MQEAAPIEVLSASARLEALDKITGTESKVLRQKREMEGVKISVWGNNALYLGTTIFFAITIGLSYINANTQINAGLYVTTASGIVCIACALGGWRFLPVPSTKSLDHGQSFWLLPFKTCMSSGAVEHVGGDYIQLTRASSCQPLARRRSLSSGIQIPHRIYDLHRFGSHFRYSPHQPIQLVSETLARRIYRMVNGRMRRFHRQRYNLLVPLPKTQHHPQAMDIGCLHAHYPSLCLVSTRNKRQYSHWLQT